MILHNNFLIHVEPFLKCTCIELKLMRGTHLSGATFQKRRQLSVCTFQNLYRKEIRKPIYKRDAQKFKKGKPEEGQDVS